IPNPRLFHNRLVEKVFLPDRTPRWAAGHGAAALTERLWAFPPQPSVFLPILTEIHRIFTPAPRPSVAFWGRLWYDEYRPRQARRSHLKGEMIVEQRPEKAGKTPGNR